MFVKPVDGRTVPDPERGNAPLSSDGREVEATDQYWQRRVADGDVVVTARPEE